MSVYVNSCTANHFSSPPGHVVQSVVSLIADPGAVSLISAWPDTFMEIDCDLYSVVILLLPVIQQGLL